MCVVTVCVCMCVLLQEMVRCDGVTIDINPQDRLPTVSADQSDNITIKYHLPQAVSEAHNTQNYRQPHYTTRALLGSMVPHSYWQIV